MRAHWLLMVPLLFLRNSATQLSPSTATRFAASVRTQVSVACGTISAAMDLLNSAFVVSYRQEQAQSR